MNKKRTPFHKLPITNRFMFAMVFSHKEIAKPFLEAILGIKIFDLQEPEPEKSLEDSPFYKGVRYDVFVKEKGPNGESIRTFDLEMQVEDTKEIPKRARYYQAMSDSEELNKGEFYFNLKEQYVIFICRDDIFKKGRAVYKFKNLEIDHPEHELGDLTFKNFYIFKKYKTVAEKSIRNYLEYFATNEPNSPETEAIQRKLTWYQSNKATRKRYMTWQQEVDIAAELAAQKYRERADKAEKRAEDEKQRAEDEKQRADRAEALLRKHGLLV